MSDLGHDEPHAPHHCAAVDPSQSSQNKASAPKPCAKPCAKPSAKLLARRAAELRANESLSSSWEEHRSRLLRSFFRDAGPLAARYRVSGEDIANLAYLHAQPRIVGQNLLKPVQCVADLAVATACCLGRANAWNELWVFAEPAMTRAAFSRLPETLALTWTRRYWMQLERESREGCGGLVAYDGSRPIRLWLVEQLLSRLESERAAGRLEIRREHLGRPIPLRLVGEQLA